MFNRIKNVYKKSLFFLFLFIYLYCILVYRTMTNLVKREKSVDSRVYLTLYYHIFWSSILDFLYESREIVMSPYETRENSFFSRSIEFCWYSFRRAFLRMSFNHNSIHQSFIEFSFKKVLKYLLSFSFSSSYVVDLLLGLYWNN